MLKVVAIDPALVAEAVAAIKLFHIIIMENHNSVNVQTKKRITIDIDQVDDSKSENLIDKAHNYQDAHRTYSNMSSNYTPSNQKYAQ